MYSVSQGVFFFFSGRFQATDRLNLGHEQVEEFMEVRAMWNTRDVALRVHSGFRQEKKQEATILSTESSISFMNI